MIGGREELEEGPAISLLVGSTPGIRDPGIRFSSEQWAELLGEPAMFRAHVGSSSEDERLYVLLADPFTTPVDDLLRLFQGVYPAIPIVGGMSSGAGAPGESALLLGDQVAGRRRALSWRGSSECDLVVSQGCRPIGRQCTVTGARDNLIESLDQVSPLESIEQLVQEIPEEDRQLLRNGLFVGRAIDRDKASLARGDFLIRGVVGIDRASGAVAIGDRVEEGEQVQFHVRDARQPQQEDLS